MTKEQLKAIENECDKELISIRERIRAAQDEFVKANATAFTGDRVIASSGAKSVECIVGVVGYKYGRIDYDLRKIKKDGTASHHTAMHYPEKVERK